MLHSKIGDVKSVTLLRRTKFRHREREVIEVSESECNRSGLSFNNVLIIVTGKGRRLLDKSLSLSLAKTVSVF